MPGTDNPVRFILLDIEGTTTDINFVHRILFPYSAERLPAFVRNHSNLPEVQEKLAAVKATVQTEESRDINDDEAIEQLLQWIREDRKHTALKSLQGLIWREGYEGGAYESHIYEDVLPCLKAWRSQGIDLGIYSSGSVEAQKLLFRYTPYGDLTPFFSCYYDTRVGGKKESVAYKTIVADLGLPADQLLFLSDVEEELDAAATTGLQTVRVNRSDQLIVSKYKVIQNFHELTLPEATN
jgi:enolase-phosphatase E1